ncbi:hypothetical protein LUZ61_017609 [Rhynchospora tenuis]|uniref:Peptidase C1A papain C-terminal domain-containing protein n=1 Tax=Rhynchospora tenuis TaxID=198213 RepID=A0AAD5Z7S4_9POAL|nr:hypothetical protein LUZ61_017609 [Rhynchospora tenuis]
MVRNVGSDWAIAVAEAIEAICKIKTGTCISLSEQELIDCVSSCNGCNGGYVDYAFQWVQTNGGITTESNYPYKGITGTCNYNKTNDHACTICGYQDVTPNCESCLMNAVARQPVVAVIEASGSAFQFYSGGIFTGPCGTNIDHAVLIVGYCFSSTTHYWIVKNSWGTSWGESGYIRMQKDITKPEGLCGIAMEPSYPVAC